MRLLALDQASRTSGYSIWEDGKLIDFGKFTFTDADFGLRLYNIREKVKSLIEENNINEVIIEDIQMQANIGNNVSTYKALAEVYGVINELIVELNLPFHSVLAVQWKSCLGIKGRARADQKKNTQEFIASTYGVNATQDESDSIGIGTYYFKTIYQQNKSAF